MWHDQHTHTYVNVYATNNMPTTHKHTHIHTHTHTHAQTHAHTPRACMCVYVVVCVHMCVCAFMNFVQPTTALWVGVDMLSDPLRCTVQLKLLLRSVLVCVNIHVHKIAS